MGDQRRLSNAWIEWERALARQMLDRRSMARLLLVAGLDPVTLAALHRLEQGTAWRRLVRGAPAGPPP